MTVGNTVIIEGDKLNKQGTVVEITEHLFAVQLPAFDYHGNKMGYGIFWFKKTVPYETVVVEPTE